MKTITIIGLALWATGCEPFTVEPDELTPTPIDIEYGTVDELEGVYLQDGDGRWEAVDGPSTYDVTDPDGRYALAVACLSGPRVTFTSTGETTTLLAECNPVPSVDPDAEIRMNETGWPSAPGEAFAWNAGPLRIGGGMPITHDGSFFGGFWDTRTWAGTWDVLAAYAADGSSPPYAFGVDRATSIADGALLQRPEPVDAEPVNFTLNGPGWDDSGASALWLAEGGAASVVPLGGIVERSSGWSAPAAEQIVDGDLQLPLAFGETAVEEGEYGQPLQTDLQAIFSPRPLTDRDVDLAVPPPIDLDGSRIVYSGPRCDSSPDLSWPHDDRVALYRATIPTDGGLDWSIRATPARSQAGEVSLIGLEEQLDWISFGGVLEPMLEAWMALPGEPAPSLDDLLALTDHDSPPVQWEAIQHGLIDAIVPVATQTRAFRYQDCSASAR